MIEQLKQITHVLGHVVQPSAVTLINDVENWKPKALEIGVDGESVHIRAETASAEALVASVRAVLGGEYEISEPCQVVADCVTVTAKPIKSTSKPSRGNRNADSE